MPFTATIVSNVQNDTGDLSVTVQYINGVIKPITETYPLEANGATLLETIGNRTVQLQAAEDFVTSNPPGTQIVATPTATPIQIGKPQQVLNLLQ